MQGLDLQLTEASLWRPISPFMAVVVNRGHMYRQSRGELYCRFCTSNFLLLIRGWWELRKACVIDLDLGFPGLPAGKRTTTPTLSRNCVPTPHPVHSPQTRLHTQHSTPKGRDTLDTCTVWDTNIRTDQQASKFWRKDKTPIFFIASVPSFS